MIEITVERNYIGNICRFNVEGHADSVADDKMDCVCAIVSTATQYAVLGMAEILDIKLGLTMGDGLLRCVIPEIDDSETLSKVNILLETMLLTLQQVTEQYPSYVKLSEMEE